MKNPANKLKKAFKTTDLSFAVGVPVLVLTVIYVPFVKKQFCQWLYINIDSN